MTFEKITDRKLSDAVVSQIELLILRGLLGPGERLPSERDLAERLGVSRPSLRDALAELEDRGLLITRRGAGVYVADVIGSAFSPALLRLFASHDAALFDAIAFRKDLEGLAARRAATAASDTDLAVIQAIFDKMVDANARRAAAEEAELDARFHLAIVEASHNIIMLHMMRSMYALLREGVFFNRQLLFRQRTTREALLAQHEAINAALQARDPEGAASAIEEHLSFIEAALVRQRKAEAQEDVARIRLEKERSQ